MRSTRSLSSIEGLLGFGPVPVPPHVFALREDRLAYGRFPRGEDGLQVASWRQEELPPKLFQKGLLGGPIREPEAFSAALSSLLERSDAPVKEASLVLPDSWFRVTFTGVEQLPSRPSERTDVLRWKLKRLVPFRVEELRLTAEEVEPLPSGGPEEDPHRVILGFALEALLTQLEDAFDEAGVHLGQVLNASLATLTLVEEETADDSLTALALVGEGGYTLAFSRHGEPVLHRFKGSVSEVAASSRAAFVERDLRLTRKFLGEQFPGDEVERVILASPPEREPEWVSWLEEGLQRPVEPLSRRHLPLAESSLSGTAEASLPPWRELAPMIGAASREVS